MIVYSRQFDSPINMINGDTLEVTWNLIDGEPDEFEFHFSDADGNTRIPTTPIISGRWDAQYTTRITGVHVLEDGTLGYDFESWSTHSERT